MGLALPRPEHMPSCHQPSAQTSREGGRGACLHPLPWISWVVCRGVPFRSPGGDCQASSAGTLIENTTRHPPGRPQGAVYAVNMLSLSSAYATDKHKVASPPSAEAGQLATPRAVCGMPILLNATFQRKVHVYLCPFFFATMISKRTSSSEEKWKSCHLHASPHTKDSLSLFTTCVRGHCLSGWV